VGSLRAVGRSRWIFRFREFSMLCGKEHFRRPSIFAARLGAMQAARPQDRHGRACGDVDDRDDPPIESGDGHHGTRGSSRRRSRSQRLRPYGFPGWRVSMKNHSISSSSQKENCPTIKKCKQYQLSVCPAPRVICGALRHREQSEAIQTRGLQSRLMPDEWSHRHLVELAPRPCRPVSRPPRRARAERHDLRSSDWPRSGCRAPPLAPRIPRRG
jgi:hypothetical protein